MKRSGPAYYGREQFAREFAVSRETLDRLELYESLLLQWQKAVNLVAPSTLGDIWLRHFADSAQLIPLAPKAKTWADLGSGGGFPGMVIAILTANQEDRSVYLFESNGRKCAFLAEVARRTGVGTVIREGRIEASARELPSIDVVTARALAPMSQLLALAEPLIGAQTRGLFLKGREAGAEIEEAEKAWSFQWKTHASRTDSHGQIVEIEHLIRK